MVLFNTLLCTLILMRAGNFCGQVQHLSAAPQVLMKSNIFSGHLPRPRGLPPPPSLFLFNWPFSALACTPKTTNQCQWEALLRRMGGTEWKEGRIGPRQSWTLYHILPLGRATHSIAGSESRRPNCAALALLGVREQMLPCAKETTCSLPVPLGSGSLHFSATGALGSGKLIIGLLTQSPLGSLPASKELWACLIIRMKTPWQPGDSPQRIMHFSSHFLFF